MKTGAMNLQTMDDLVFENRNKDYGAYVIRLSYSKNLVAGFFGSMFMVGILFMMFRLLLLFITAQFNSEAGRVLPVSKPMNPPTIIPIEKPPVRPQVPFKNTSANLFPIVTTHEVPDILVIDKSASINTEGTETGTIEPYVDTPGAEVEIPKVEEPVVLEFAEFMPQFEGGLGAMMKFIQRKTHYPRLSQVNGIEGTVFVSFVVDSEGRIVNVKILKGISSDCDQEAMRVIAMMPRWKPGMQNHAAVSVRMVLPMKFKITE